MDYRHRNNRGSKNMIIIISFMLSIFDNFFFNKLDNLDQNNSTRTGP